MSVERPMMILQRSADLVTLLAERGAMAPAEIAEYVDTPRSSVYRLGDALRDAADDRAESRRASPARPAVASVGRCRAGWDE